MLIHNFASQETHLQNLHTQKKRFCFSSCKFLRTYYIFNFCHIDCLESIKCLCSWFQGKFSQFRYSFLKRRIKYLIKKLKFALLWYKRTLYVTVTACASSGLWWAGLLCHQLEYWLFVSMAGGGAGLDKVSQVRKSWLGSSPVTTNTATQLLHTTAQKLTTEKLKTLYK